MKECNVEQMLVKCVAALGGEIRKVRWIGRQGAPDRFVMLLNGVSFWVELKAPKGKLSPMQVREHARFKKCGQTVYVFYTIEQVLTHFTYQAMENYHAR